MATMTPAALLVGFCAAMTAIALGRLAVDDDRSPIDVGTALIVLGITLLSGLWIAVREAMLSEAGWLLLGGLGLASVGLGAVLVDRHWRGVEAIEPPRRRADDDADGEGDRA